MASPIARKYGLQPRGVLNFGADDKRFSYLRCLPSPDLGAFVEHFWMIRWDLRGSSPYRAQTVSHPSVQLGLQERRSRVYGVIKGRSSCLLKNIGEIFGVKFRPGGFYPFVKFPLARITNRSIPLAQVFGRDAKQMERSVLGLEFGPARAGAAEEFLLQRLPECDEDALFAGKIVEEICLNRDIVNVDQVVGRFALTKRTLQRMFSQYIGVSPKWVIKVYRLHESVERLNSGEAVDLAGLAQEVGYFDQAHFVKDFKSVVGHTPGGYLKQLRKQSLG